MIDEDAGLKPQRLLARPALAAEILDLGRTTIFELIRAGELPVVRVGRATRIPVAALEAWVLARAERDKGRGATESAPLLPSPENAGGAA